MLLAGEYHTLTVVRNSDHGLYLTDGEQEVLLPKRYITDEIANTTELRVFIYHDSENRLVATTEQPYATVSQAAYLEVVDKTIHGAFLDWGLYGKHLFLPNSNQQYRIDRGHKYIVMLYRDNITGRVVATTKLSGRISNSQIDLKVGQQVEILVAQTNSVGFRVIIDNKNWGMLYRNQLYRRINIGERLTAFVTKITDDNRIDLSLHQTGYRGVKDSADELLELLNQNNGTLPLNDDSTPEQIAKLAKMSKKAFKRAVGQLLKKRLIERSEKGIKVVR